MHKISAKLLNLHFFSASILIPNIEAQSIDSFAHLCRLNNKGVDLSKLRGHEQPHQGIKAALPAIQ